MKMEKLMKVKLDRLFMGLQECLGQGDFEDSFREYLDTDEYGKTTQGDIKHRFEEYIVYILWNARSIHPLCEYLGRKDTLKLAEYLGVQNSIKRESIVVVEKNIMKKLRIPNLNVSGRRTYLEKLKEIEKLEPDSAVPKARRLFEQLFREILLVSMNSAHQTNIVETILNRKKLRLPRYWPKRNKVEEYSKNKIIALLKTTEGGYGDFGFFIHLIHYASLLSDEFSDPTIPPLSRIDSKSFNTFMNLSSNLNETVHFKGDFGDKQNVGLQKALSNVFIEIENWVEAKIIPDTGVFLEFKTGLLGSSYRGINSAGNVIEVQADELPLGEKVLFWETNNPVHKLNAWETIDWA